MTLPRRGPLAGARTKRESRVWDLYVGELNPLVTNKANFFLVASVTLVLTLVALASFYGFMEGFFVFAYAILPSFTTVFAATTYTRDRASGFASVVLTVPVSSAEYFLSKFLATMTLGLLFLLLAFPFTGLAFYFLGGGVLWGSFGKYLVFSIPLMAVSTALGLFVSVVIGKRGLLAASMTGFGVTVLFAGMGTFLAEMNQNFEMAELLGNASDTTLYQLWKTLSNLSHLAPVVNAMDFADAYPDNMSLAWKALFTVTWIAVMLSVGAWLIYTKLQNVEGWDCPKWIAAASVVGVLAAASAPVFVIDYFDEARYAGLARGIRPDTQPPFSTEVRLIPAGIPFDPSTCYECGERSQYGHFSMWRVGETRQMQLVILFRGHDGPRSFENVKVHVYSEGDATLRIRPADTYIFPRVTLRETPHGVASWRAFDVNVTATSVKSLGESSAHLQADVTYNGKTHITGSMYGSFLVLQPAYEWYYPLYVAGACLVAEAAPFLWRMRSVGRRGV